jgi:hypothetical protein
MIRVTLGIFLGCHVGVSMAVLLVAACETLGWQYLDKVFPRNAPWIALPGLQFYYWILWLGLVGAVVGMMAAGFQVLASRISSGRKTMRQILAGTFVGALSGSLFAVFMSIALQEIFASWRFNVFWFGVVDHLREHGFHAILEGTGWGAVIGTLVKGFQVINESICALAALKKQEL